MNSSGVMEMNPQLITADGMEIKTDDSILDETVTDEMTTSELLVSMNNHLENIESGINHIVVLGILLITWLALCRIFGKWYFGGV